MSDWQKRIAKFAHRVETHLDAQKEKLGILSGGTGRAKPRVEAYRGYGTAEKAVVMGRVLRGSPIRASGEADGRWVNLAAMIQRFESDEVPGARLRIRFPGGTKEAVTDEEGYFTVAIERPGFPPGQLWNEVDVDLVSPAPPEGETASWPAHVLTPPEQSTLGIISDIDDTVVRTEAADVVRMVRNVFLANARTRVPFPGVAAFYRALQHAAGETPFNPVFYVSSSPWNLHDLLTEFLTLRGIPLGPLMLRDWGITQDEVLPTGHGKHKLAAIRRILDLYPGLPFLLIGDSGQEDPEIYSQVVKDYPERIAAVYIRNVTPHPERVESIRVLSEEVKAAGSTLLLAEDTLTLAKHALGCGWITEKAVGEVAAEVGEEKQPTPAGTEAANEEMSSGPGT